MVSQGFFSGGARNTKQNKKEDKPFFSQRLDDVKVASNQVQPLSEIGSKTYEQEVQKYIKDQKSDPYRSLNYDEEGYKVNKFRDYILL